MAYKSKCKPKKPQNGTASLSKRQRAELNEFRRRNFRLLKSCTVVEIVQIWRDGYICGAIHGLEVAAKLKAKSRA